MEQETNTVCTEDVLPCMVLNTVRIFQLIILFIKNVDSGISQKYLYVRFSFKKFISPYSCFTFILQLGINGFGRDHNFLSALVEKGKMNKLTTRKNLLIVMFRLEKFLKEIINIKKTFLFHVCLMLGEVVPWEKWFPNLIIAE